MAANADFILEFIRAQSNHDLDKLMEFFAEDCIYHNIPMAPVTGTEAIRKVMESFAGMADEVEWVTHQIAETEAGVVLTERTDRFKIGDRWVELPVMGTFEVHDRRITAWRDYFDMKQFTEQLPSA